MLVIVETATGLLIILKTTATRSLFIIVETATWTFLIVIEATSWTVISIVKATSWTLFVVESATRSILVIVETALASRFVAELSFSSLSFFVTVTVRNSEGLALQEFFFVLCRFSGARTLASVFFFCHYKFKIWGCKISNFF